MIDANSEHQNKNHLSMMSVSDSTLVSQYKDLIREQDAQIQQLKQQLNQTHDSLTKRNEDLEV